MKIDEPFKPYPRPTKPLGTPPGGPNGSAKPPTSGSGHSGPWTRVTTYHDSDHAYSWDPPGYAERGLEIAQITGDVALKNTTGSLHEGMRALNGVIAVGTAVAGIHDLVTAKSALDRLGGASYLALAADVGLTCLNPHPSAAMLATSQGLAAFYGAADVVLGACDFKEGLKEKDKNCAAAGLFQMVMGTSVLASITIPVLAPLGDTALMLSLVGRHLCFEKELGHRRTMAAAGEGLGPLMGK